MAVHLCPVCKGKGLVNANFYNVNNEGIEINKEPIVCRTCKGEGVLWDKVFNIPQESPLKTEEKSSNYNPEGDPKNKKVDWSNAHSGTVLNDGFLGKVGI